MGIIKNFDTILQNAHSPIEAKARMIALTLLEEAIFFVDPKELIQRHVTRKEDQLKFGNTVLNLAKYDQVLVAGAGKASGAMAEALEIVLGGFIETGLVNIPKGIANKYKTYSIELQEAGHPVPDEEGFKGTQRIAQMLKNLDERTLVIFLLSGGGSALLTLPKSGITLFEMKATTDLLLKCGATIEEINAVRKHLSAVKGGQLASITYPATLVCLILSDVVGDPLPSIASGPTVGDPTTYSEAMDILQRYNVWSDVPKSVRDSLRSGQKGELPETPKPGDPKLSRVHNILLGNNRLALDAMQRKAIEMGLSPLILSSFIEGEAREVGKVFAGFTREMKVESSHLHKHSVLLAGGETTVHVTGKGRGGRNHELVLSAALNLRDVSGIALASIGTDGMDGTSDAAGAIADGYTLNHALSRDMNPHIYLENNDSHTFFANLGDGIVTGPTGTNVNDLTIIVNIQSKG